MAKRNGAKAELTPAQSLAGLRARETELQAGLTAAISERESLMASRPEVAAAALVNGDASAQNELKDINARLLTLADTVSGYEFDLSRCRADIVSTEAQIAQGEAEAKRTERAKLLQSRDENLREVIRLLAEAGTLLTFAKDSHVQASRLAVALGENPPQWDVATRAAMAAITAHLGGGVDLNVVSRTTAGEARRRLAAAAPVAQPPA